MATVTPAPARKYTQEESRQHVHHPLQRLRGTIRLYVALEGLGVLLLCLALWFWIGLLLDYGVFKVFGLDWVQKPVQLRVITLALVVAGLLAVVVSKVVLRLFREFRAPALALVLERRFPELLGDRLITAVEMADPRLAPRYGFSQAMIDHTIQDAAERVDQLPLGEVFNWKRLLQYGLAVVGLTLGLYVLVGAAWCAVNRQVAVDRYYHQFNDVAAIWAERNILLWNTIWPRRAHLEVLVPETLDKRVGRNNAQALVKVRAWQWVMADPAAREGWRGLRLDDLTQRFGLAPAAIEGLATTMKLQTVDEVEQLHANAAARQEIPTEIRLDMEKLLLDLEALAAEPRMSRKLRKLVVPERLTVEYWGGSVASDMPLLRAGTAYEYEGTVADLKESVTYTVAAEDYATAERTITVVPPPALARLERSWSEPAYLYYRPPQGGKLADLKGLLQKLPPQEISRSGDLSRLDVKVGSDLELIAVADKDLTAVTLTPWVRHRPEGAAAEVPPALPEARLDSDRRTFRMLFPRVSGTYDFKCEFIDTDQVPGSRHILIKAEEDTVPEVDALVEVLRRTPQANYLVTPFARVPLVGTVRDDNGLSQIEYHYTSAPEESQGVGRVRAALVAASAHFGPGTGPVLAPLYLELLRREMTAETGTVGEPRPLDNFAARVREIQSTDLLPRVLADRLAQPPGPKAWPREHILDGEAFDLRRHLPQLEARGDARQQRYKVRLWLEATDNNIEWERKNENGEVVERGPRRAPSKEKFSLLVVSVEELLSEIAKEEESLNVKLTETYAKLLETKAKLDLVAQELRTATTIKDEEFSALARRCEELEAAVVKGSDLTREVFTAYSRILRELEVNGIQAAQPQYYAKVRDSICNRLEGILLRDFPAAEDSQRDLRRQLEGRQNDRQALQDAQDRMDELLNHLKDVLDAMGDITTINDLIKTIRAIEEGQRSQLDVFRRMKDRIEGDLIKGLEGLEKP